MGLFDKKDNDIKIDKKTHLLVLDNKWHELFENKKSRHILQLEKSINNLLKEQGKCSTDVKDYHKLKRKLMDEIVNNMSDVNESNEKKSFKKMSKSKKYIEEINEKIKTYEARLEQIPNELAELNGELVRLTMNEFYHEMLEERQKSEALDAKIKRLRSEISEAIIERDETSERSQKLYGYIHDVVGPEVMESYDSKYAGDSKS